ncbi:glycosyl hydrolase family 5 [Caballeronia sp. 15715]|uniref:glycosyl hydrolase family 5 n=1 Tax=Caballeronia sp. 15715 TaxID=3391030 RepID=UPI0039E443C5
MKNPKDALYRRAIMVFMSCFALQALPALATPTIAPDGARDSAERTYTALPLFPASRADTGVAIHDLSDMKLLDAVKDVGFSFVRTDLFWGSVQNASGWHFSTYDTLVSNLAERGLGSLFILGYDNDLYSPRQAPTTPSQLAAFHTYVYQSALRYKKAAVRFEVWNEQDSKQFWLADPSPSAYRTLLKTAVNAAKSANPKAIIATGGVTEANRSFIRSVGDISATQMGPDAVGVHPYRQQYPETVFKDYRALDQDLSTYHKVPQLWATELGYPTYGYAYVSDIQNGHSPVARERQAKYTVRLLLANWISQIGLTAYYDMRNDGTNPQDREHNFGLLDADNTKLPVYNATKHLFSFTANVSDARYFINDYDKYIVLKLLTATATKYVIWCYGDGSTIDLDTSRLPKNAIVTDMYGTPRASTGIQAVPEEMGPVFVSVPS